MKNTGKTERYGRLEIELALGTAYVDILRPDGGTDTLLPFWKKGVDFVYDEHGYEWAKPNGKDKLCVRYTPDFVGEMEVKAVKEGKIEENRWIMIAESTEPGYVGVDPRDPRYFAYTDGTAFFMMGMNAAYPTSYGASNGTEFGLSGETLYLGLRQYAKWFRRCAENGVNTIRLWVGSDYFTPDTEQIGLFREEQFSKLDAIFDLARTCNIKLKLTLEQFRTFRYDEIGPGVHKAFIKRLYDGNLRCESAREWVSDSRWKEGWIKKVDQFARRYSGDTALFAIELWNEMNAVVNSDLLFPWNREMLPRVKKLFPKNMVINSLGSLDCDTAARQYMGFPWEESDCVQVHRYLDQGAPHTVCRTSPVEAMRDAFERMGRKWPKPLLVAETGAVNDCHSGPFRYYSADNRGMLFVDCVYPPVFLGGAGCGNIWHWDDRYVEGKNLYPLFMPLAKLTEGVDFAAEEFQTVDLSDERVWLLLLVGKTCTLGFVRNRADSWQTVLRDDREAPKVDEKSFALPGVTVGEILPIWAEDTTECMVKDGWVRLRNIRYGALLRLY